MDVLIDSNLKLNEHITTAIKKANGKHGMLKRAFVYLDNQMLVPLHTALVCPHLPYKEILKNVKLPSLAYRRIRGDMVEVNKYCHSLYQVDRKPFKLMSEVSEDSVTRENSFKIYKATMPIFTFHVDPHWSP